MKLHAYLVVTGYTNKITNMTPLLQINEHNKNKINSNSKKIV